MNKEKKFKAFLESFKGNGHDELLETVIQGFSAIHENEGWSPTTKIIEGYIEAMFFTEGGPDGEIKDAGVSDMAPETMQKVKNDVNAFYNKAQTLLDKVPEHYTDAHVGHDFWLTRNGHGAGFWDRDLGELGDKLTELSKQFGESNLYLGDDGKLYLM